MAGFSFFLRIFAVGMVAACSAGQEAWAQQGPAAIPAPTSADDASKWPEFAVHAPAPAGLSLTLSLPKDHFYQGEIIPAILTYADSSTRGYQVWGGKADRSGRLPNVKFGGRDETGAVVEDSLGWIFNMAMGRMGGGAGGDIKLGFWDLPLDANQWLRFDHPGRYKIAAWSDSVEAAGMPVPPFEGHGIELVSSVKEITIDPLPPEQAKVIVDDARKKIDAVAGVNPNTSRPYPEGQRIEDAERAASEAVVTLRFLQTPEARAELRQVVAQSDVLRSWEAGKGLYAAPDPPAEARLLLDDVKAGRIKVNDQVVGVYGTLMTYPNTIAAWRAGASRDGNAMEKVTEANDKIIEAARLEILAAARAAAAKSGTTDLDLVWTAFLSNRYDAKARADLIAHQLEFSQDQKQQILYFVKNDLSEREHDRELHLSPMGPTDADQFLPLVREQVAAPYFKGEAFALLAHLRPTEAKPRLIQAIAGPDHRFFDRNGGFAVNGSAWPLLNLPAGPIPELQQPLRDLLHQDRYAWQTVLLIDQYGGPELLPDVIDVYRGAANENVWIKAAALRFWIRNDPPAGIRELAAAMQQRTNDNYKYLLQEVLLPQWDARALPLVIQSIDDPVPEVKHSALQVIIAHGDASCAAPALTALDKMGLVAKAQAARDLLNTKNWTWTVAQQEQLRKDAAAYP